MKNEIGDYLAIGKLTIEGQAGFPFEERFKFLLYKRQHFMANNAKRLLRRCVPDNRREG